MGSESESDDEISDLINSNLKPSEVNHAPWLYCVDTNIYKKAHSTYSDPDLNGKWMMFFKKGDEMDSKWKEASELYHQGKLDGISQMKVATNLQTHSERSSDSSTSVICFYCGPADDEMTLMEYGKNLLRNISYNAKFMRYKSDKQTRGGTIATGQRINSMYKIMVSDINSPASSSNDDNKSGRQYRHNQRRPPWRQQEASSSTATSSNQNWRYRNRYEHSEENNWRKRNDPATNWRSVNSCQETNWRQANPDQTTSNQSWRRNNFENNSQPNQKRT